MPGYPAQAVGTRDLENLPIILVVDDDPLCSRLSSKRPDGDGGFETVIAASGEKAVELLDTADGKYRALVTDINLGRDRMKGWDVARRAREIDPRFPVVYMSGESGEDWSSRGVPDSIMLAKPVCAGATGDRRLAGSQQGPACHLNPVADQAGCMPQRKPRPLSGAGQVVIGRSWLCREPAGPSSHVAREQCRERLPFRAGVFPGPCRRLHRIIVNATGWAGAPAFTT